MSQQLIYIILILGCIYLILDEFTGNKRITNFVKGLVQ